MEVFEHDLQWTYLASIVSEEEPGRKCFVQRLEIRQLSPLLRHTPNHQRQGYPLGLAGPRESHI